MNIVKKIYCRVFQKCFKIAIPILPYRQPELIDGFENLPAVLEKEKKSRVMIVTDQFIAKIGLLDGLKSVLESKNIPYFIYDKTTANPTTDNVAEALEIYKTNNCDSIIGFGGGSSMDCAKGLGVRIARPRKTLDQLGGILKVWKKLPLLIAVPTTAGTGSETTLAAVIRNPVTKQKYAINDFPLIPRYAVLEPKVTLSLPANITASTGMDALTHAVEAFIGGSTTKKTRKYALDATKLIFANIEEVVANGSNEAARKNMLEASFYAGCAFTVSYVGYVHAIAHSLGGYYNTPHGLANAIILPHILKAYGSKAWKKLAKLAVAAGIAEKSENPQVAAEKFIAAIEEKNKKFGIGTSFDEIKEEDIPSLSKHADKEANPLYPVPVLWNAKELEHFYYELKTK